MGAMGFQSDQAATRGRWMALAAALLGWMFDGFEMGLFPLVARPALSDLLDVTDDAVIGRWIGVATAGFLVGAATGGVLFGWLGDRIGRVRAMTLSVLTYAVFSGLCGVATSAGQVAGLRFLSRPAWIRVESTDTPFTALYAPGEELEIPIAHGDGRYVTDERTAAALEATGRVVWRYVRDNPNGSTNQIAGVVNADRNVVGIMPHPERRNAPALGGQDGARIFHSMEARHATQHAVDVRAVGDRQLRV